MMSQSDRDLLSNVLANTLVDVRRLTEAFSENDVRRRSSSGEFSVVENLCHLRDIELEGYTVRIKRILEEDQPFLADLDGARLAEERDYNKQDLKAAMDEFARVREENVRTIRELSPEQLMRIGTLENTGEITLESLLDMMRSHDAVHVAELTKLRDEITQNSVQTQA